MNLTLNTGWAAISFQAKNLPAAAVEAGVLALSSADLARRAWQPDRASGALLIPYAGWTTFTALLSTRLMQEN